MKLPGQNLKLTVLFILFAAVFCLQAVPRMLGDSLTADEPTDITNGYYYLTQGDARTPHNHPPLAGALTSWPLLFMHLNHLAPSGDVMDRAHHFLFEWNLNRLESIIFWARFTSLLLALGIGLVLFGVSWKEPLWLIGSLSLWAFDPLLGALSGLAKTDIAPAFFIFLAVWAFQRAQMKTSVEAPLGAGLLTGLAVGCKFYGLVLLPLFMVLEWLTENDRFKPRPLTWKLARVVLRRWGLGALGFFLVLSALYLPGTIGLPDHPWPWNSFIEKLGENAAYARQPHPVFFWGTAGLKNNWFYLPCAFLLKEPIPFLLLLVLAIPLAFQKRIWLPGWLWVSPLLFTLALLGTPNLGVRYLLPAFPFLFLVAARAWAWMAQADPENNPQARAWKLAAYGLLAWQVLSVGTQSTRALSYFNDWVPADRKMFLLGDSNLDWGQDLKRLASEGQKRGWGKIRLAYYGAVDPKVYGLNWEPWTGDDLIAPQAGKIYAVNASFLQIAPVAYPSTQAIAQSWIIRTPPTGTVGETWFYFEIPGEKEGNTHNQHEDAKTRSKDKLEIKSKKEKPGKLNQQRAAYILSVPFLQTRGYTDPAFLVHP